MSIFKKHRHDNVPAKPRRQLLRGVGGEITIPVPRANHEIKELLKVKVKNVLGELIVPRKYKKLVLQEDGTLKTEYFTVSGRKIPLSEIRKRLLKKHQEIGLLRDYDNTHYENLNGEEINRRLQELGENKVVDKDVTSLRQKLAEIELTRHLMVWHDNSSILNHGHHLVMVAPIFDPAFYFTSSEMEAAGKGKVDVSTIVETPHIYIMGRCNSSEAEKIAYSETCREDLMELGEKLITEKGNEVVDVMRFFKGDTPEQQFETGEIHCGKTCGCGTCDALPSRWSDLSYCFQAKLQTVEHRRQKVLAGPAGREKRNGGLRPFDNMKVNELKRELKERKLSTAGNRMELEQCLKEHMAGIQRVPALLFGSESTPLSDLYLDKYEVSSSEPLHDIKEHIKNITTELPYHLNDTERKVFCEAVETIQSTKAQMHGSDYRLLAVKLSANLRGKLRPNVQELLDTLSEISHLLYLSPECRNPRSVLRLYNRTFLHCVLCIEMIGIPKKLTVRKFYGKYFHSISCHTPALARIISLSSLNSEDEERTFNAISNICRQTSSRRPDEIVENSIVRYQAEANFRNNGATLKSQQSEISKISSSLPPFQNTTFSKQFIQRHRSDYQAHLERISDFLLPGKDIWWALTEEGVQFKDGEDEADQRIGGPPLHHFRSSDQVKEEEYLKETWSKCIR